MNKKKVEQFEKVIQKKYGNTASLMIEKDGEVLYEKYFNGCNEKSIINLFSATKSVVAILIGIAIDQGYIESVKQKVLDFFPEYQVPAGENAAQKITLENLLTMTMPLKFKREPYEEYFTSDDWVKFALDHMGGKEPDGTFRYMPIIGPDIMTAILQNATGMSAFEFATTNLFGPLDIHVEKSAQFESAEEHMAFLQSTETSAWAAGPTGVNAAGWGLSLTTRDIMKIGKLYLNRGMWEGQQIVSKEWIERSVKIHSTWKTLLFTLNYGYLWWIIDEDEGSFAALGDGGNTIYVNTKKNLVIGTMGLYKMKAPDRMKLIRKYIEPAIEN